MDRSRPFVRSLAGCLTLSLVLGAGTGCGQGTGSGSGAQDEKVPEGFEKVKESMKERMAGKGGRPGAPKGARGR